MTDKEIIQQLIEHRPSGRTDKYSFNLYQWLKARKDEEHPIQAFSCQPQPCKGEFIIGKREGGYVYGSIMSSVMVSGRGAGMGIFAAYQYPIPNFWQNYHNLGKCYLDPEHKLYPDNERWEMIGADHRRCQWCGREERRERYEEVVQRQRWILEG